MYITAYTPLLHGPHQEKTSLLGFRPGLTKTGLYIQLQEKASGLKFWIMKKMDHTICIMKTKAPDQLCSYCTADLRLWFRIDKTLLFS